MDGLRGRFLFRVRGVIAPCLTEIGVDIKCRPHDTKGSWPHLSLDGCVERCLTCANYVYASYAAGTAATAAGTRAATRWKKMTWYVCYARRGPDCL